MLDNLKPATDFAARLRDAALKQSVDKLERYKLPEKAASESNTVKGIAISDGAHLTAIFIALTLAGEFIPQPWAAILQTALSVIGFLGNKRALDGRRIAGEIIAALKKKK